MGHELTHGFDDNGRMFDADGNLDSWWESQSAEAYLERTQCMRDQYANYQVGDVHVRIRAPSSRCSDS